MEPLAGARLHQFAPVCPPRSYRGLEMPAAVSAAGDSYRGNRRDDATDNHDASGHQQSSARHVSSSLIPTAPPHLDRVSVR